MIISINKLDYAHMLYMAICDYDYYHWLESFRDDDDDDVFTDIYENNASLSLSYFTDIVNDDDDDDAAADILMMIREYRKMMR